MDKTLTKRTDKIIFVKVENDGFDLGAQRRPIDKNDLPEALKNVQNYLKCVKEGKEFDTKGINNVLVVEKDKIGESGEWNLSGERYKAQVIVNLNYSLIKIGDLFETSSGGTPLKSKEDYYKNTFKAMQQLLIANFKIAVYHHVM